MHSSVTLNFLSPDQERGRGRGRVKERKRKREDKEEKEKMEREETVIEMVIFVSFQEKFRQCFS